MTQGVHPIDAPPAGDVVAGLTPHNLDAEKAVLGAVLIDGRRFANVVTALEPHDWFRDVHSRIFDGMAAIHERGESVDFLTVKDELQRRGQLEDVGGPAYLASLTDGLPVGVRVPLDSSLTLIKP
jgi:replicative DNA helicase